MIVPWPLLPADVPASWLGALVFVLALALFAWAAMLACAPLLLSPARRLV